MKKLLTLIIFSITGILAHAQQAPLFGYVEDEETGEALIGATVYVKALERGVATNNFGFYSISLPVGTHIITFSYVGYTTKVDTIRIRSFDGLSYNTVLEKSNIIEEVEVVANKASSTDDYNTGSVNLSAKQIEAIPPILGEVDVIKALQLLPGVSGGTEASSGMYVRGGGNDQNLILLDGVPLYNVSHMFGFFSLFNTDVINNVRLYKGGFPSRFGGRLSSVIDVTTIDGNNRRLSGTASIGLLSGKISLNGPLTNDGKTTFSFAARRSFLDLLVFPFSNDSARLGYYFYDLNGKITHKINDKSKISFSAYNGRDQIYLKTITGFVDSAGGGSSFSEDSRFRLGWGNSLASVRYSRVESKKLFSTYGVSFTRFGFNIMGDDKNSVITDTSFSSSRIRLNYKSNITDLSARADYEYHWNENNNIRFGAQYIAHIFTPGSYSVFFSLNNSTLLDTVIGQRGLLSHESAIYVEDDMKIGSDAFMNLGVRLVNYSVGSTYYNYAEPRVSITKNFDKKFSLFSSYTMMNQFVHLVANSSVALPADLWLPATEKIKPMTSHQASLGMRRSLGKGFDLVIDGFYKHMINVVDYREGVDFANLFEDIEERVAAGIGRSYGIELLIQKQVGKFKGWLAQTYSKTDREIPDVNFGRRYDFKYDRPIDISLTVSYEYSKKYTFSANFVYATGNALTMPIGQHLDINGRRVFEFGNKNSYRMRDYHRFDLGFQKIYDKKFEGMQQSINLSFYNLYARHNPFFITPDFDANPPVMYEYAFFRFVPGITYQLKF